MRANRNRIREHAEVIGDGRGHVGAVDEVEGKRTRPTRGDCGAGPRTGGSVVSFTGDRALADRKRRAGSHARPRTPG